MTNGGRKAHGGRVSVGARAVERRGEGLYGRPRWPCRLTWTGGHGARTCMASQERFSRVDFLGEAPWKEARGGRPRRAAIKAPTPDPAR